jgi:hypothetical protein
MTLEQFAKKAGVTIVACDPDWGGRVAYTEKDYPNSTVCGFRSEGAAYKHWLNDKFGPTTAKVLLSLMRSPSTRRET